MKKIINQRNFIQFLWPSLTILEVKETQNQVPRPKDSKNIRHFHNLNCDNKKVEVFTVENLAITKMSKLA